MAKNSHTNEHLELKKFLPNSWHKSEKDEELVGSDDEECDVPKLRNGAVSNASNSDSENDDVKHSGSIEVVSTKINQELKEAVEASNESAVEECLFSKQADPNFSHGPKNVTCLHLAAKNGNLNIVKLLVKAGAEVNATDSKGVTPLHVASGSGLSDVIEFLVQSGADLNVKDWAISEEENKGESSASPVNPSLPSKLSVKVSHENEHQRTNSPTNPFHLKGNKSSASDLSNKTSSKERGGRRETPLHRATRKGHLVSVRILLSMGADIEAAEGQGKTALHLAAEFGNVDCMQLLLERSAYPNSKDNNGNSPLTLLGNFFIAQKTKDLERYKEGLDILIKAGARLNNVRDHATGASPLHQAVTLGHLEATELLLSIDASLDARDAEQNTAMHSCCMKGHSDVLKVLLDAPDARWMVNSRDSKDRTPLHKAAFRGFTECIQILLEAGADLGLKTKSGVSAMTLILQLPKGPKILSEMFDESITTNGLDPSERNCLLKFDFSILISKHKKQQMNVIEDILDVRREQRTADLLQHPLIATFLFLKWRKIRLLFFSSVITYIILVVGITADVWAALTYDKRLSGIASNQTDNFPLNSSTNWAIEEQPVQRLQMLLIFVVIMIIFQEIVQFISMPAQYFQEAESYIKLGTLITSSILVLQPIPWSEWVHFVAAWAVLFGWAEVTFLIGRLPTFGVYALMFYSVALHLGKFVIVFCFFLFGFSFSFHIIFVQYKEAFANPWSALLRTLGMMTGDFSYDDYLTDGNLSMSITAHLIYLLFIMLVSLVLMNLLIGLAVSDIQGLQKEGTVKRLRKQAQFIVYLEDVVNNRTLHRLLCESVIDRMSSWINQKPQFAIHPSGRKPKIRLPSDIVDEAIAIAQKAMEATIESTLNDTYDIVQVCANSVRELEKRIGNIEKDFSKMKRFIGESGEETLHSLESLQESKDGNMVQIRHPERVKGKIKTTKIMMSSLNSDLKEIKGLLLELKASKK